MTIAALDSNILVYAFSDDDKSSTSRKLLELAPVLSAQALNEFAHVARRKWRRSWSDIAIALDQIREASVRIDPVEDSANATALRIADRYQLEFFDALMVATAIAGGVGTLYSEDMQNGLVIDETLRIVNPFANG